MERHASTLYTALAARVHEINVFTVPSDRRTHPDIHDMSILLPMTMHVLSIVHYHLKSSTRRITVGHLIMFIRKVFHYHIGERKWFLMWQSLGMVYELNVHVVLNGVDETKFVYDQDAGARFRKQHGVPSNASVVMEFAGRLVRDKGHALLCEAFLSTSENYPGVFLLVAGTGPWGKRYAELGSIVKVLGALEPSQLSEFYNALDIFINPTLRPQGLDLTLMEAMQCGKPVLTPNYPRITGTVVINEGFGYTFCPNVGSFVEALQRAIRYGRTKLHKKGMACKAYASSTKMASAYERFFLCMKNSRYCKYPLPTDC
ncbi:Glycosyl transferase, family [Thalictrum thalictroides]|uniref:Glycosyl transferase, family n=1 Tax=Thalictrum thalictroides TaxID=46969 RepID=A0A7J6VII1_THATH|nr:Glycosyl transferase, family [Thalictrum thalictroides]